MTEREPHYGWLRTSGTTTASFSIDVSEHESGIYALMIRSGNVKDGTDWTANICPVAADDLRSLADIILSALPEDRADCPSTADSLRSMADPMFEDLIDERHNNRCTDCHEPTEPVVVCESCAMARCESVAAAQRKRDAEICRSIHSTSRQRVELALLCARKIEASDHTHP